MHPMMGASVADVHESIEAFLAGRVFAVAGASKDRNKYGNKVLRCYLQHAIRVFALNPSASEIEGAPTFARLADLPEPVHGLSIVTPPPITERLVEECASAGIRHVWMQPGAESARAIERARELGLNVIARGPCLLVVLGYRE